MINVHCINEETEAQREVNHLWPPLTSNNDSSSLPLLSPPFPVPTPFLESQNEFLAGSPILEASMDFSSLI